MEISRATHRQPEVSQALNRSVWPGPCASRVRLIPLANMRLACELSSWLLICSPNPRARGQSLAQADLPRYFQRSAGDHRVHRNLLQPSAKAGL